MEGSLYALVVSDDLSKLPLKPPRDAETQRPTPAPAWVALVTSWLGLICVIAAVVVPFVPGSKDPRAEQMHLIPYSTADRVIAVAMYLPPLTICFGAIVIWQMRKEARPLPDAMVLQRLQAWVGITLALIATVVIYVFVIFRGPSAAL